MVPNLSLPEITTDSRYGVTERLFREIKAHNESIRNGSADTERAMAFSWRFD
jgi:hypothetical protein